MRPFLCFFLTVFFTLASTYAYNSEQSPLQVDAAILLGEDGTPRCRIGSAPELDSLRECDETDELYARMILGTEEISLGMAAPTTPASTAGTVMLLSPAIGGLFGCAFGAVTNRPLLKKGAEISMWTSLASMLTFGASTGTLSLTTLFLSRFSGILLGLSGGSLASASMGIGILVCNKLVSE